MKPPQAGPGPTPGSATSGPGPTADPARAAQAPPGATAGPARRPEAVPGSIRDSLTLLGTTGAAAVVLLALTDGVPAAATGLGLLTAAGLLVARFTAGGGAQDSGFRRSVRLLGSRAPVLGQWQWIVSKNLGPDGDLHFATTLRPQLQRLFRARLAERHGVDLERAQDRARALVGPELWPWIDPAVPPPQTRLTAAALSALLDRLEALDTAAGPPGAPAAPTGPAGAAHPTAHPGTAPDRAPRHRHRPPWHGTVRKRP